MTDWPVSYYSDMVQVALAALTVVLALVSTRAYRKRPEARYLLLVLAFVSLCVVSVSTMSLELFVAGGSPTLIPFVEVYLVPSLELLMVISFLVAIAWSPKVERLVLPIFLVAVLVIGLSVSAAYLSGSSSDNIQSRLPAGCARPAEGFLLIASSLGYNDSVNHGAPVKSWPVLDVPKGSEVTITVCNTYLQPVGFQVMHYLENPTQVIAPGHIITVNFVADQTGSFLIYCSVFSAIHLYLQGGEVNVM